MGYSSLLDIIGSSIMGGFLLLILLKLNASAIQNRYVNTGDLIVQQDLLEIVKVLEYDFKKIGYCKNWEKIPDPSKSILYAGPHSVKFITDLANPPTYPGGDGVVDTLYYYVGTTADMSATPNPRDIKLFRVVNHETPNGSNLGVTQFDIKYFNAMGDSLTFPISVPSAIYTMQISITVENTQAYAEQYSTVFWRQIRVAARNLRNR